MIMFHDCSVIKDKSNKKMLGFFDIFYRILFRNGMQPLQNPPSCSSTIQILKENYKSRGPRDSAQCTMHMTSPTCAVV
jgi:hypothetical protein